MLDTFGTDPITDIVDISASNGNSILVDKYGNVYSCGYNVYGQLGDYTNTNRLLPVQTKEMQNVVQVSAGRWHALMLRGDGTVWGIGRNYYGELGINSTMTSSGSSDQGIRVAKQVMNENKDGVLKDITEIACGGWHSVALTTNKQVLTWGYGGNGQLGNKASSNISYPRFVLDNTDGLNGIGNIRKIGTSERITF